jgi:hypothetical protein
VAAHIDMTNGDLRDQIARLENQIEDHAKVMENCRKIIFISKAAILAGAIWVAAVVAGAINFKPFIITGIAGVVFGIVGFGSNASTLRQTAAAMKKAAELRDELIDRIGLPVAGDGGRAGETLH